MKRQIVAIEADWHSNNRYGLLNPGTLLYSDDEGEYQVSAVPVQKFLWELREQNLKMLQEIAADDDIAFIHLGDPSQGFKHNTEYVSNTLINQHAITVENARPVFDIPNVKIARFIIGTEAHEGVGGSYARLLYDHLKMEFPTVNIRALYHSFLDFGGDTFDCTHHGPTTGIRTWSEGNQLRAYARDIMMVDHMNGRVPPRYMFRGHVHRRAWETVRISLDKEWLVSDIIVVPSMCDMGAFARQITRSENRITNGMVVMELIDGRLVDIHWLTATRDMRTREVL